MRFLGRARGDEELPVQARQMLIQRQGCTAGRARLTCLAVARVEHEHVGAQLHDGLRAASVQVAACQIQLAGLTQVRSLRRAVSCAGAIHCLGFQVSSATGQHLSLHPRLGLVSVHTARYKMPTAHPECPFGPARTSPPRPHTVVLCAGGCPPLSAAALLQEGWLAGSERVCRPASRQRPL